MTSPGRSGPQSGFSTTTAEVRACGDHLKRHAGDVRRIADAVESAARRLLRGSFPSQVTAFGGIRASREADAAHAACVKAMTAYTQYTGTRLSDLGDDVLRAAGDYEVNDIRGAQNVRPR